MQRSLTLMPLVLLIAACAAEKKELALGAADSVKRLRARSSEQEIDWYDDSTQSVYEIRNFIEFKTTWHPIGA